MKITHYPITLSLFLSLLFSRIEAAEKYSQIQIFVPDRNTLSAIWSSGIDYEGAEGKIGGWMRFVAGDYDLQRLSTQGIPYQVVIDDLAKHTENLLPKEPVNALGFGYGSMGGFYT